MFKPTTNQEQAVVNMTTALEITPLDRFDTYDAFQKYFEYLMSEMKKSMKQARFRKAVASWKVDMKKLADKNFKYYEETEGLLKQKAEAYVEKYNPSIKQLERYLRKKSRSEEQIKDIVEDININEEELIRNIIDSRRNRSAHTYYKISSYLFNKMFDQELIKELISEFKEEWNSEEFLSEAEEKARRRCLKRCSKQELKTELYSLGLASEQIEELIYKYYNEEEQADFLELEIEKLKVRQDNKKIINTLMRKGYNYNEIKSCL